VAGLNCRYCGSPVDGAVCAHCGAPAPDKAAAAAPPPAATTPGHDQARGHVPDPAAVAGSVVGAIRSRLVPEAEKIVPEAEKLVRKHHPAWQWRAAGGVLVVALLLLVVLMIRSCSLPGITGGFANPGLSGGPARTLPGTLATASCEPPESVTGVERCVVSASDPLLSGGITGGRDLPLRVQTVPPAELAGIVRQWRAAGGSVVSDSAVFVSISASSAVLYADTGSGLRIDTGSFTNNAAAQTFLSRSGLLGG
jgi:hypothetical protein